MFTASKSSSLRHIRGYFNASMLMSLFEGVCKAFDHNGTHFYPVGFVCFAAGELRD